MTSPTQKAGQAAEEEAWQHLRKKGFKLLARNYTLRAGELDLVVSKGACLVFVEVRYRANPNFGTGGDSVNWRKQQKLVRAAEHYLHYEIKNPDRYKEIRFDVVSLGPADAAGKKGSEKEGEKESYQIEWIQDAFSL